MVQYWRGGESLLQVSKCLLTLVGPGKGSVLPSELVERLGNLAIVLNELLIKVAKTEERLDAMYSIWWLPLVNHSCFLRINLNPICAQDEAQVLCSCDIEFTLLDTGLEASSV